MVRAIVFPLLKQTVIMEKAGVLMAGGVSLCEIVD